MTLPFSVYDFFGYLASGFVVLLATVAAFVGADVLNSSPSIGVGLLVVVASYTTGHIVAGIAGDLLERRLVHDRLGSPTTRLLSDSSTERKRPFSAYRRPLPEATRLRIRARASEAGLIEVSEGLFFHCHATLKKDEVVQGRLNTFLNLYGFCRNMSTALVIAAVLLGVGVALGCADTGEQISAGWWIVAALIGAVGMLYRYLKFFRQFGVELLTSYAEHDGGGRRGDPTPR